MAAEDVRMLRTALLLHRFTLAEICRYAQVNRHTASSWLKRNLRVLEEVGSKTASGRGRPLKNWRLPPSGHADFEQQLRYLSLPDEPSPAAPDLRDDVSRIQRLRDQYFRAIEFGDEDLRDESWRAARFRTRLAWENYSRLDAAGYAVPNQKLAQLAEYEREFRFPVLWDSNPLPDVVTWMAKRIATMREAGATREFAGRVIGTRARAWGDTSRRRLTAAALAAQVWADEPLMIHQGLSREHLRACESVLEPEHTAERGRDILAVLNPANHSIFRLDFEQQEAIVYGVAYLQATRPSETACDWMLALPGKTVWRKEYTAAVVYGALDGPLVFAPQVLHQLRESLRGIARMPIPKHVPQDSVRRRALEICQGVYGRYPDIADTPRGHLDVEFAAPPAQVEQHAAQALAFFAGRT